VVPEKLKIELDGVELNRPVPIVLMLHKSRGTITTRSDERGRPTVFDGLPAEFQGFGNLHAVGRLDAATTGLLLLTNDTKLSSWLTDPVQAIPRLYRVTVRGEVTSPKIKTLLQGVPSEVGELHPTAIELLKASQRESHLLVTLQEGKNREVRRLFESVGHEVTDLKRLAFGGLRLGDLPVGTVRKVSDGELALAFPGLLLPSVHE
jgi:pseudouridine synthase